MALLLDMPTKIGEALASLPFLPLSMLCQCAEVSHLEFVVSETTELRDTL